MLIATYPPLVSHRSKISSHPLVDGLRFNTVMPIDCSKQDTVNRLLTEVGAKPLWLDLKTRQLRITRFTYLPYAFVTISHKITVNTPTTILFKDEEVELIKVVDGNKLILGGRPHRIVGEGQPINILDDSLTIDGFLTEADREYINLGVHRYMLSFVEDPEDIAETVKADPQSQLIAKIESQRGLVYVRNHYPTVSSHVHLMAARDDLLINMGRNRVAILDAMELIVRADPEAIVASRILTSLEEKDVVTMGDLSDLYLLTEMGYRNFMFSDGLCFNQSSFSNAITVFGQFCEYLERKR